ncbi:MAG: type II toxin-antitoxin system VapC family toxin [Methanobacteriota archaeon]
MLFVDASFLVALMDEEDQWHEAARQAAPALAKQAPWKTHALALGEVVAVLGSRRGGKVARQAYEMVRDTGVVALPTLDDLDASMVHVVRHDGRLSLSDGLFIHYASPERHAAILSFDGDFDSAGLNRLPRSP